MRSEITARPAIVTLENENNNYWLDERHGPKQRGRRVEWNGLYGFERRLWMMEDETEDRDPLVHIFAKLVGSALVGRVKWLC